MAIQNQNLKLKLLQIFQYLNAYQSLKNPVHQNVLEHEWFLWLDALPAHETVIWNRPVSGAETDTDPETGEDFIVKIRRPLSCSCPEPPLRIAGCLKEGWRLPDKPVELTAPEEFAKNASLVEAFKAWLAGREIWAEQQVKARRIMEAYDRFYNLYAVMKREAERVELVWADGILKAKTDQNETTMYPLVAQRVELVFDAEIPEFKLVQSDQKPEFNSDILRQLSNVNADVIGDCRGEFESRIAFLYDNDLKVNSFLKSTAAKLGAAGRFTADLEEFNRINEVLVIVKRPVLLLRNRTTGFTSYVHRITADIDQLPEVPDALAALLGFETREPGPETADEKTPFLAANGDSETVLFSKEANLEQLQIVQKLERSGAVLVQGPPGTGKTHTIANLIGHFLAQGKTVLVTSHTSKALRVLKEKIVPSLQPLCVALLNDDREQLERCVEAITEFIAFHNPEDLEQEAAQLKAKRSEMLNRLWEYKKRLLALRKSEYLPLFIGEKEYQVKEAALIVAAGPTGIDWIPAPVNLGSPLPLAQEELVRLYQTNGALTPQDELESKTAMPELEALIAPGELERWKAEVEKADSQPIVSPLDYWESDSAMDLAALEKLAPRLRKTVTGLKAGARWEQNAQEAGILGSNYLKPWEILLEQLKAVFEKGAAYQTILFDYEPSLPPELISESTYEQLVEMAEFLEDGKKFGFLTFLQHKEWKELIQKTKLKNAPPETADHFRYLAQGVRLELDRVLLKNRWRKLITEHGGPDAGAFGSEPEKGMRQYSEKIGGLLRWYSEQWRPLEQELAGLGFRWQVFLERQPIGADDASGLKRLTAACADLDLLFEAVQNRLRANAITNEIEQKAFELTRYIDSTPATQALRNLKSALAQFDPTSYRQSFQRVKELAEKSRDIKLRIRYLDKLAQVAPAWADAIRNREGVHGGTQLPGEPEPAWEWRQLYEALEARNQESMDALQQELDDLNRRLREVTVRLIEKKAWAKICRTSVSQRQALVGWKELIKKIGKRTGKRVPIYLEEARKLMPKCQTAVPVWIMPLIRVAENFDPAVNKFDVVIIDEASQSDAMALTALYLGKQVVVVGDDQQVSPEAVGQDQDAIQNLISEYLGPIPNSQLYDGQSSVYDLAKCSFDPVCLREHFRCVAPIIEFSNRLSYDGRIKPLRDDSEVTVKPPTVAYRVNGMAKRKVNRDEAEAIAALIMACIEQPEYASATFGVIALVGTEQALMVDTILRRRLPEKDYAKRQILCGNPAQFQGDERDIVFISVVDSGKEEGPLTLRGGGARDLYRKRYNVAASRARNQLWVVHSLDVNADLKPDDLRLRLIKHAENPDAMAQRLAAAGELAESEFERQVQKYLIEKGYRVCPQWKVGSYRIDMVVTGAERKIAIECDGEKYHTDENLVADMTRQAILERLGWRFIRIRGSRFFREPEAAMAEVYEQLAQAGITPEYQGDASAAVNPRVADQVIRRAEAIRSAWQEPEAVS